MQRLVIALGAALLGLAAATAAPVANDPVAIVTAIYQDAIKDNAGGNLADAKARAKLLSKSLAALWREADARTPAGEIGPVDFDPVSNSQNPAVTAVAVKVERQDSGTATVAATLIERGKRQNPADAVVRYDFVRDGGHWRIDDIRGSVEGAPWSVRQMLAHAPKR